MLKIKTIIQMVNPITKRQLHLITDHSEDLKLKSKISKVLKESLIPTFNITVDGSLMTDLRMLELEQVKL